MSKHHPWTAFYWEDWGVATAHLSHLEYSIYHRLLTHYYRTQKPLLANATSLQRLCQSVGSAEHDAVASVMAQFFELRGDKYHNKRADEEIERALSISNERAQVGKKGGLAKARNLLQQKRRQPQSQYITPPTPLSGGLTEREFRRVTKEMQEIARMMQGADYDTEAALQKACMKAGVDFERARYMLGTGAA